MRKHRDPVLDVLKRARKRLTPPNSWTQHVSARDASGRSVPVIASAAVCFCLDGAIHREAADYRVLYRESLVNGVIAAVHGELSRSLFQNLGSGIAMHINFNDHPRRCRRDVLTLLDRAIKRREAA